MERFAGNIGQETTSPGKVACAVGMTSGRLLASAASFVSGLLLSESRPGSASSSPTRG